MNAKWDMVQFVRGRGVEVGFSAKMFKHAIRLSPMQLEIIAPDSLDFVLLSSGLSPQLVQDAWQKLKLGGRLVVYERIDQGIDVRQALGQESWSWIFHDEEGEHFVTVFQRLEAGQVELMPERPPLCAAVVRPGAHVGYGDALWASSVVAQLHGMGYHVTVYTDTAGEEALRFDPHVSRFIVDSFSILGKDEIAPYWDYQCGFYDRWVNLSSAVEDTLLISPSQLMSLWPQAARHERTNQNYLAAVHAVAGLPYVPAQKFYPTNEEMSYAHLQRGKYSQAFAIADTGSTDTKWYPFMGDVVRRLLDEYPAAIIFVLGKLRTQFFADPRVRVIGMNDSWRRAAAICMASDVVIGQETGLLNAVAFEAQRKVVLMTHSSVENLTRDWVNTEAIAAEHLPCYPCHVLHFKGFQRCVKDVATGAALCQASMHVEWIMDAVRSAFPKEAEAA